MGFAMLRERAGVLSMHATCARLSRMLTPPWIRDERRDARQIPSSRGDVAAGAPAGRAGRIGVLLVNLGTPDATDAAVGAPLPQGIPDRPAGDREPGAGLEVRAQRHHPADAAAPQRRATTTRSGTASENESPLKTITRAQAEKLARHARAARSRTSWSTGRCATAIPSLASRLEALVQHGCERILVVPLYPQYAAATTATVCDAAFAR